MTKSSNKSDFYTYVYYDPERNVPMYVGKGSGKRSEFHLKKQATNKQFRHRLITLKRKGLTPLIEITAAESEEFAFAEEIRLIALFGRRDRETGTLYNLTDGGEGSHGVKLSEETKLKISKANKNPSAETRAKQSAWIRTPETKQKIGEAIKIAKKSWTPEFAEAERIRRTIAMLSSETRKKMSESAKSRPSLQCPHCGKIGKAPGIRRHHFEYCSQLTK